MPAPRPSLSVIRHLLAAVLLVGSGAVAQAQTWDGGGSNNAWSTAVNWSTDTAPATNAAVTFAGSVRLAPDLTASRSVSSLTFASGAAGFILGSSNGSTLTLGSGGLVQASSTAQTISHALTLSGSQTWNLSGGDLLVSGPISSNFITLTKSGSGNLTLSGNNSGLTGPLVVNAGTVTLASSTALGSVTFNNTVASGATLALTGGVTLTEGDLSIAGSGVSGGGALRSLAGANTLAADLKLSANATVAADAGSLNLANTVALGGRTLTLAGSGAITTAQAINNGGTVVTTGSGARTFNGAINANFTTAGSGAITVNQSINAGNSGTVTLGGSGSVALNGAQVNSGGIVVTGSTAVTSTATLNLNRGDLVVAGSGSVAFNGANINVDDITVSGSGTTSFGTQINASGGTFTQSGTGTTTFEGSGTNFFSEVNITGGTIVLDQTGGAAFQAGSINISDAEVFFSGDNQIAGFNSVTLGDGATLYLGDTDQSFANLTITGDSILDFGSGGASLDIADLDIASGATLTIVNWNNAVDFFIVDVNPGSTTLGQVVFADFGGSTWNSDGTVTATPPIPEPAAYGLALLGGLVSLSALRRRPRPHAAARAESR